MLKDNEICPGITFQQHAESLAMFDLRNNPMNDREYNDFLPSLTEAYVKDLTEDLAVLQPYSE